jgi:hypothetical protein
MSEVLIPMQGYNMMRVAPSGEEDSERYTNCEAHPMMRDLMAALATKRPKWTYEFFGRGNQQTGGHYWVDNMRVMEDGVILGTVTRSYYRETCYGINNARMRAARERGHETRTKDLKKAVKHILTNFYLPTPTETVNSALGAAREALTMLHARRERAYREAKERINNHVMDFVFANWETFTAQLTSSEAITAADQLVSARDDVAAVAAINLARSNNTGTVVAMTGRVYYVQHQNEDFFHTYTPDDLPVDMRSAVGMLKLLEPKQFITDVGMRVDDNTFYIIPQN